MIDTDELTIILSAVISPCTTTSPVVVKPAKVGESLLCKPKSTAVAASPFVVNAT